VPIDAVRVDSAPPFDIYIRPGYAQRVILYCEQNVRFLASARDKLKENRVEYLYVPLRQRSAYGTYLNDHMRDVLADPQLSPRRKAAVLYDAAQAVIEEVLAKPPTREQLKRGKNVVRATVDFMRAEDFRIEDLLRTISCDFYAYTHSINVVAYTVGLAQRTGVSDHATLREIANGALLHDIGKQGLDPEVVRKKDGLSKGEWDLVRRHPEEGYELLAKRDSLGEVALDIVLHHHERLDGAGYPDRIGGGEISPYVRMVSIADVFDALTTDRYHQGARNTFEALSIMHQEMRPELDMDLLRAFVEMMGGSRRKL
jgi:HD-GYP domain-containing protein (c-di-GMP phosphodiesterase class II)